MTCDFDESRRQESPIHNYRSVAPDRSRELTSLTIRSFGDGDMQVIRCAGRLDIATAGDVEHELQRVELTHPLVIAVDLRELSFIDSTGIRLMFDAQHRASWGSWRLIVVRGTPAVQRSFEIRGVADQLPFVDALPSATATEATGTAARRGGASARATRAPRGADTGSTTAAAWRVDVSARVGNVGRDATSRRIDQAALAAAVRQLRTHRRAAP